MTTTPTSVWFGFRKTVSRSHTLTALTSMVTVSVTTICFYVPNIGEYVLTDPSEEAEFEAFLRSSGLAQYRGRVAPRNAFKAPRVNTVDLNMSQELPAWGPVRPTLFFNIKNLGNLLNSDWGQVQTAGFDGDDVANLISIDDNGVQTLNWNGPTRFSTNRLASQWRAQIGFRLDW